MSVILRSALMQSIMSLLFDAMFLCLFEACAYMLLLFYGDILCFIF